MPRNDETASTEGIRQTRGADVLVDALVEAGVTSIFGVPGDTGVTFYDALRARTDDIRHILARDERHAAKMADAYARVTNQVGVVEVSSGGGTTFVVGGLGEAYASSVPILLITSDIHVRSRGTGALTEIDQVALFSAVTKWSIVVESPDQVRRAVHDALRRTTSGRPGPVAVIVPENVLDELAPALSSRPPMPGAAQVPQSRPPADDVAVQHAARILSEAENPAILAGSGVHLSRAWSALARLTDLAAIPVATTIHGIGALPHGNEWLLGVAGNNGGADYANRCLQEADAVLLIGTRANATDTNSWTGPAREGPAVIQVDIDPDRAGQNFPGSLSLVGDAQTVLVQLIDAATPATSQMRAERLRRLTAMRRAHEQPAPAADLPNGQLLPADIIACVHEVLGAETVVVADPGTPTPNVAMFWRTATAGRRVIIPRGHGPMGYAIPGAIGASFARPGEPIVAFTADGSFAMACGELETAVRFRLPVLYIQFTNHSLGWIKMLQHLYSGGRYFSVDPGPIDAVMVAHGCGMEAELVDDLSDFSRLVESFKADPRPLYLDIEVPHMIDHTPPVPAWHDALAGNPNRPIY